MQSPRKSLWLQILFARPRPELRKLLAQMANLQRGVQKTRAGLVNALEDALQGKKEIDADLLDELEFTLVSADIGVRTTTEILDAIRQRVERHQLSDVAELKNLIRERLLEILQASERGMP